MHDETRARRCDRCCFCRDVAGARCCVRNPPAADRRTGRAHWPRVEPTDTCGCFRDAEAGPTEGDRCPCLDLPIYTDRYGPYCKIPLTQGRFAKVDPAHYPWLAQFRWHCKVNRHTIYAVRTVQEKGRSKRIFMHRMIMDTPEHLVCDHVNHEGLDNRIANLRNCTVEQNNANRRSARHASSRFLGVAWDRRRNKWVAYIKKDGKQKTLGLFDDEIEAAHAHDTAARRLHGSFAHLNFPNE